VFAVRDSKNRDEAPLILMRSQWSTFVDGVMGNRFDLM
jgi:hypothetical protein